MKKILVMGLPGTGKTTFSEELRNQLQLKGRTVIWYNADFVRQTSDDWDFSKEGRIKQAKRMKNLADTVMTDFVICDFVAPLREMRDIFSADYTIWMDTEKQSNYNDTDKLFEPPILRDYIVKEKNAKKIVPLVIKDILRLK